MTFEKGQKIEANLLDSRGWREATYIAEYRGEFVVDCKGLCFVKAVRPAPQPPGLIPWGPEDISPGMKLRMKEWRLDGWTSAWCSPAAVNDHGVFLYLDDQHRRVSYKELLGDWEVLDGKPCGKEKK